MHTTAVNGPNSKRPLRNIAAAPGACAERSRRERRWPAFSQQRGQTLILFVLFMFMLILFVGLGIDLGFAYITRARLSKAVDSACLMGVRNLYRGDDVAKDIARSAFNANYGTSARDTGSVTPAVTLGTLNNNITLDVSASTHINTFFIRIMPALFPGGDSWQTLPVGSAAQATRPNLILSLVLDRSGSMKDKDDPVQPGNDGMKNLKIAVPHFIDLFDDQHDRASMSSFSYAASDDVTMRYNFKDDIKTAVNALVPNGWTCSERGLTNGLRQNLTATAQSGEKVIRVILFFSDGMANTWYHTFDCGPRNIAPDRVLYNPITGNPDESGCTKPATLPSINVGTVNTFSCFAMNTEAQARAERIAWLARDGSLADADGQQITVYAIGLGDPNAAGECGGAFQALNPEFLKNLANTPDSQTHDRNQPEGNYAIAINSGQLDQVFQKIGKEILGRLTK